MKTMQSFLLIAIAAAVACDGQPITGPEAEAAFDEARSNPAAIREDVLVFVDGEETDHDAAMSVLKPEQIQSIEVVKGQKAIERYGERGSHGVILIRTKAKAQR